MVCALLAMNVKLCISSWKYTRLLVLCGLTVAVLHLLHVLPRECTRKARSRWGPDYVPPSPLRALRHYSAKQHIRCSDMRMYVKHLCAGYTDGVVAGSLCKPLCKTKEMSIIKCIRGHRLKPVVMKAEWKGEPVIIKSVRPYSQHSQRIQYLKKLRPLGFDPSKLDVPEYVSKNARLTQEEFIKQANVTLYYGIAGGRVSESTERVLKQVVSECDLHGDELLEHDELIRCWQMVESEEYIISSLLQGNPGVPKVRGVCGELYAEDYAAPLHSEGFMSFLDSKRSWKSRAGIILAIIDLLEAIEYTPYGTLYYCDVTEANIGVLQKSGRLVAKAIDLDHGWFGDSIRVLKFYRRVLGKKCNSDLECDLFMCHFACNTTSHTCTDTVISNNLQVICQNILTRRRLTPAKRAGWITHPQQSLPTVTIQQELERIVQECANPTVPQHHLPRELLSRLRNLLLRSLQ